MTDLVETVMLSTENLRWFWIEYRSIYKDKLTINGAKLLFALVSHPRYWFPLQPLEIQKRILEMLRTNHVGEDFAKILENRQPRYVEVEQPVILA